MHEPCPSQPYDRDAILDSVSRWTSEPAALLDLLAQVGGYGHLCARGPGVECDGHPVYHWPPCSAVRLDLCNDGPGPRIPDGHHEGDPPPVIGWSL